MRSLLKLISIQLLMLSCLPFAQAQDMKLQDSAALSCLIFVAGAPDSVVYPPERLARKEEANFEVELEFRGPDAGPKLIVDHKKIAYDYIAALEDYVKFMRVPCMSSNQEPVRLRQRYVFSVLGQRPVQALAPTDADALEKEQQLKCLQHVIPNSKPIFPRESAREGDEGVVITQMRFIDPNQAPIVTILPSTKHKRLINTVKKFTEGLRMPCLGKSPIDTTIDYRFVLSNEKKYVLRDLDLINLLKNAKNLKTPVDFDFNTMSCPFEVKLTYYQPILPNKLQELDNTQANRLPFLNWLKLLEIDLDSDQQSKILGDFMVVTVPCGILRL
jgi:hypothetical protein